MKSTAKIYKKPNATFRKVFFFVFIILIIIFIKLLSLWYNDVTLKVIIIGSTLCITTVLFSYFYGIIGGILSALSNIISATANYIYYTQDAEFFRLTVSVFLFSFAITNILIGFLSQSRSKKEIELIKKGNIDALTNVFNHGYFAQKFEDLIKTSSKKNEKLYFVLLDIDNFKMINDYFGHKIGDEILVAFSNMITSSVRQEDHVFRYGGDEFVILIPNASIAACKAICNRILKKASEYINTNIEKYSKEFRFTASVGISCYPTFSHSKSELQHHADVALYESKHSGRNKFTLYNTTVGAIIDDNLNEHYEYVKSLLLLVDSKDKYTYGHSLRVSSYASDFGDYLGLGKKEVLQLKIAGLMHDAGKIECDKNILIKNGSLTSEEWKVIKQHPQASVKIVEKFITDQKIIEAIKFHHERYDGLGYTNGLQGNDIPLYAMILNIVDSFDAMRSLRVYSKSFSIDEVKQEIEQNIGTQFSPYLATKYIEYLDQLNTDSYERFNYKQTFKNDFLGLNIEY